jgi:filamentous hemagglutinin
MISPLLVYQRLNSLSIESGQVQRVIHILLGDKSGGGHLWPGLPGKSPFPKDWSPQKIIDVISDVATNPGASVEEIGKSIISVLEVDGIIIKTIIRAGRIITGYPINVERNPE